MEKFEPLLQLPDIAKANLAGAIMAPATAGVSFDLFDTLLVRRVLDPGDLFAVIATEAQDLAGAWFDFRAARETAETAVRRADAAAGRLRDPTLAEIYVELGARTGLPEAVLAQIQQVEIAAELRFIAPRSAMRDLYNLAFQQNKPVAVATDTYLPRSVIEQMLSRCGYDGGHRLLVSSELGLTKKHGTLFARIAQELGLERREILHLGDNPEADKLKAEAAGLRALLIPTLRERLQARAHALRGVIPPAKSSRAYTNAAARFNLGLQLCEAYAHRPELSEGEAGQEAFEQFGRLALGPFVQSAALAMLRMARQQQLERIVFLARDGWLPLAAAQLLRDALGRQIELEYLPISRRMIIPLLVFAPDGLERLLAIKADPSQTALAFIKDRFGAQGLASVADALFGPGGLSEGALVQDSLQPIQAALRARLPQLQALFAPERAKLLSYYRRKLPSGARIGLFDVGRKGTFQAVLRQATGAEIFGFYIVTDANIAKNAPDGAWSAFLGERDPVLRAQNPDTVAYEALLSERGGSYLGLDAQLQPLRAPFLSAPEQEAAFAAIHQGALEYVRTSIALYGTDVARLELSGGYAAYGLEAWQECPLAAAVFEKLRHEDDLSRAEAPTLASYFAPKSAGDGWLRFPAKTSRKRVVLYTPALTRVRGGAERIGARLANHLALQNYEVLMVCAGREGDPAEAVYPLAAGVIVRNADVREIERLAQLLMAFQADAGVVLASGPVVGRLSQAFLRAGVPYMLSERAAPEDARRTYWAGQPEETYSEVYDSADCVSVQFDSFREAFPAPLRARIKVLPNPIELPPDRQQVREPLIVCAARIWFTQKRQDLLLRAFAHIAPRHPEWRIAFYGHGYERDAERLAALAEELGVGARVTISPPIQDIEAVFARARLKVLPSAFEGFPNALAEAMAAGLPCLGLRACAGVNELIEDGVTGVLVEDRDLAGLQKAPGDLETVQRAIGAHYVARLAAALDRMLADPAGLEHMGAAARTRIARYGAQHILPAWEAEIAALCAQGEGAFARQRLRALEAMSLGKGASAPAAAAPDAPPPKPPAAPALPGGDRAWIETQAERLRRSIVYRGVRALRGQGNGGGDDFDLLLRWSRRFKLLAPPPDFDDAGYLAANADVAAAVKSGAFPNGYAHYVLFGWREGRNRPSL